MSLTASQRGIITGLANDYLVPVPVALALVAKESSGNFFWNVPKLGKLPALNIEPHYFYKHLPKHLKEVGVKAGLASPKRKSIAIPKSYSGRYAMLARMVALHAEAAYKSISIGAGQVMGSHYKRLGYKSAFAMITDASTVEGQVRQMMLYLTTDDEIYDAVVRGDVKVIARLYNGPAYSENNYDVDLAKLIALYDDTGMTSSVQIEREKDDALLVRIKALGFADVASFQSVRGLSVDSIIGPITTAEVAEAEAEKKSHDTAVATKAAGAVVTVAVPTVTVATNPDVIGAVVKSVEQAKPVIDLVKSLSSNGPAIAVYVVGAVILSAVIFTVVKVLRSRPVVV